MGASWYPFSEKCLSSSRSSNGITAGVSDRYQLFSSKSVNIVNPVITEEVRLCFDLLHGEAIKILQRHPKIMDNYSTGRGSGRESGSDVVPGQIQLFLPLRFVSHRSGLGPFQPGSHEDLQALRFEVHFYNFNKDTRTHNNNNVNMNNTIMMLAPLKY